MRAIKQCFYCYYLSSDSVFDGGEKLPEQIGPFQLAAEGKLYNFPALGVIKHQNKA